MHYLSYIADTIYPVSVIQVSMKQDQFLDETPNSLVRNYIASKLSNVSYEENPHDFLRFVGYYGTHVIQEAEFGGVLRFDTNFKDQVKSKMSFQELEEASDSAIKSFLISNGAKVKNFKQKSEDSEEKHAEDVRESIT